MATRTLSRRALRDQYAAAEPDEPERDDDAEEAEDAEDAEDTPKPRARKKAAKPKAPAKVKAPAKPRARKKAVKVPQRMVARWAVFDNGAKRLAVFEYRDRAGADAKLAEVRERKPGTYYLSMVKEPYDPPAAPAEPAAPA